MTSPTQHEVFRSTNTLHSLPLSDGILIKKNVLRLIRHGLSVDLYVLVSTPHDALLRDIHYLVLLEMAH